jgi:deoxyribonuclease V
MRLPRRHYRWTVSPSEAIAIQRKLSSKVEISKLGGPARYIAGLDAAFTPDEKWCVAALVLWDMLDRVVVEQRIARSRCAFPYIPGLLSFREAPALLAALKKLKARPDVLMCDGQGLAHPRRFGIACHVGLLTGLPSIGCAKSILVGEHGELKPARGSKVPLEDRGERLGTLLRTRDGVNPVYVSVGHRIDLPGAEKIVLQCAIRYRLPEPTRLADQLSKVAKKLNRLCMRPSALRPAAAVSVRGYRSARSTT